jgi:hypothetical protein
MIDNLADLIARARQHDPDAVLALADLVEASLGHLGHALPRRRRGGDPMEEKRVRRDAALRDLARLISADLSLEQRAAEIIVRARRYRPAPSDDQASSAERRVLHRIAETGLPVPGRRQLRRILGNM